MNAQALLSKYVQNSEKVFTEIQTREHAEAPSPTKVAEVMDYAKRYLIDAKYYGEKQQYETGLVSIAYCEGMLDALRLLSLVEFTWPDAKEKT